MDLTAFPAKRTPAFQSYTDYACRAQRLSIYNNFESSWWFHFDRNISDTPAVAGEIRRCPLHVLPLVLSVLLSTAATTPSTVPPATASTAPREWRDSIRDVYIDGKLERSAQTLTSSSPRMIAVVCGEEVLLLDPETQAVSRAPKSEFTFAAD